MGVPSSLTIVVMRFVVPVWAAVGVQVIIPLVSMAAPVGGFTSEYVRLFAGISLSVAVLVTTIATWLSTVRFVCTGRTGALFTSVTTTTKLFEALNGGEPLSVTTVVMIFVLGPCASLGVHVITPADEIVAPAGGPTKE